MKKVAQYLSYAGLGGTETHVENLMRNLHGYDLELVTTAGSPIPESWSNLKDVTFIGPRNFKPYLYSPNIPQRLKALVYSPYTSLVLLRNFNQKCYLKTKKIDLIHFHAIDMQQFDWTGMFGYCLKRIKQMFKESSLGIPTLFTDHSIFVRSSPYPNWIQFYLDLFDNIICVEKAGYDNINNYMKEYGTNKNVWFIPNSVDINVFSYSELINDNKLILGYTARLGRSGDELLLNLIKNLPDFVELHIAGGGPNEIIQKYNKILNHPQIKFYPNIPNNEIASFYRDIHVLFNPMPLPGRGRNTLEALSCGRPVIRTLDKDRYPLIDGKTGYLIENNLNSLLNCLNHINKNREELVTFGKNARKIMVDEFSNDVIFPKIKEIYDKLIKEWNS